ncbi:MAG: GNAT family N-acetyltransferase [Flavobacteriaceae bacterium CG_4_8_14_3_um_filter_34_10]|nr:GNAT family N-acetyltransferase [Flavobacteriia bacterium]PIQ18803.1 MAG: GNAT family N-acetyltransferase [Flavobacteriaceae bacterium CG18_big_fil_WC_8_21_14_2_50_34_36]PIX10122.1 MAG: GNAT family N-acetyltransferase [Flavobacteriaceae bacterium CG_4_8_14_3_um_filter_34_10]PIZ07610.1 MAG: GNAT family N-acetyltransferase [Flavobacteriaceae bacterium CG_4_10_14_0_8_um_filter_34_31]PJC07387.1 MAG: GNAT family N-acetyltransferase [Flavobacteriaceae bacterium CG_4_9_14_0_8_um_filter_34_30]
MQKFRVEQYQEKHKKLWDEFVSKAKNATFLFYRDFMEYHSNRFTDFSLLVFKENTIYALLPANVVDTLVYSHQGLTYGSFVLQEDAKLLDSFEAFKSILEFLHIQGIKQLDMRIIPSFYNTIPSDEVEYFLYKAGATIIKRDILMVIDYRNKLRFQKNRREGINKAIRNGLHIQVEESFEEFWDEILIPNLKNKHQVAPVHSLEEINLLATRFPKQIKQINVYKDNKIVAGTTVFLTKTTIHPQYVSGNEDKNQYGSLDLLYDFIINKFCTDKDYFDFNISSEQNGNILNQGLIFWKESCGARSIISNNYLVDTASYKTLKLETK